MKKKAYRKEKSWFNEDEQISRELRQASRVLREDRCLVAGTGVSGCRHPGLWRISR